MDIPQSFSSDTDVSTAVFYERQQREMERYMTRYVYIPFQDGIAAQVPSGYVPAGVIHPIPAPKGKINAKLLPEGAQILELVAPGAGESASVAVYLHEVLPVVHGITSVYGREGAIEVVALAGVPVNAFEHHRMNDLIFGSESEIPRTATAIRERMQQVIKQTGNQKSDGARTLVKIVNEILNSVAQCERFSKEHVRQRHLEMDDPQNGTPKRYSRRDQRAIEFVGAVKREEYLQEVAEQQKQAMAVIPKMLEAMERRDQQWAQTLGDISKLLTVQTEALKSISAKK